MPNGKSTGDEERRRKKHFTQHDGHVAVPPSSLCYADYRKFQRTQRAVSPGL
jgi:hypothetical protein